MENLPEAAQCFARELAAGKTRRAAYRAAYPAYRDRSDKTVDNRSAALLDHGYGGRVKQLYYELAGLCEEGAYSRAQALKDLMWARDRARGGGADDGANLTAFLRAVEQLIQLSGLKKEENGGETVTILDDLQEARTPSAEPASPAEQAEGGAQKGSAAPAPARTFEGQPGRSTGLVRVLAESGEAPTEQNGPPAQENSDARESSAGQEGLAPGAAFRDSAAPAARREGASKHTEGRCAARSGTAGQGKPSAEVPFGPEIPDEPQRDTAEGRCAAWN